MLFFCLAQAMLKLPTLRRSSAWSKFAQFWEIQMQLSSSILWMPWWSFPNKGPKKSTSLRIPCDTAPSWHLARFSGCVSCDEDLSTFVTQPSCRSWQTKIMMVHTSRASFWTLFNTGLRPSLTFTTFLKRRVESFKVAVLVQVTRLHDRVRDTDCQDLSSI